MNGSSLIPVTIHALNTPTSTAITIVKINASQKLNPIFLTNKAATTPENAAREPADKSFKPAIIK